MSGQTGRIVGMIAGAALAYFTGGASYVALGATLGGAVGSLLDPKAKTEGPRLDDAKVQFSSYGVGIPRISGTERVGGNVIWSTDKLEIASVTSSGKGGGGTENTSYKYYVHMTLLLQETPRDGSLVSVVKILKDGELIWDASSGIPVGSALASAENPYSDFVLFQGHQDQLPDPIEESWTGGPGSCSAYRGVVRARMIAVECPGGRVPQFSFVLSTGGTVGVVKQELFNTPDTRGSNQTLIGIIASSSVIHSLVDALGYGWPRRVSASFGEAGAVGPVSLFGQQPGYDPFTVQPAELIPIVGGDPAYLQLVHAAAGDLAAHLVTVFKINAVTGETAMLGTFTQPSDTLYNFSWAAYDETTESTVLMPSSSSTMPGFVLFPGGTIVPKPTIGFGPVAFRDGVMHILEPVNGATVAAVAPATGLQIDSYTLAGITPGLGARVMTANPTGVYALVINTGGGATGGIYKRGAAGYTLLTNDPFITGSSPGLMKTFYCDGNLAIVGPSVAGSTVSYNVIRFNVVTLVSAKVKDIIAGECQLAGVTAYDVSGIPDSDTVHGYKRANPASARANIEPLLALIGGFVVDEDGASKFKKYADITSVATITFDELGQAEGDASGEAMPLNRTQEIDLPRSVTTSYINPSNDYQTAAETELRQVTDATEDLQVQLPVCVTSDQAKKVSQMVLYDRWRRQNTRSTTVSRKFAFASPGDGVTVEYPRGTFKLWLLLATNDTGAVCEWSLCPGDASIFTQTAVGATGYTSQQVAALPAPTRIQILDMPIVRDDDNDAGIYVALDSYAPTPASAELFVGDDDATLATRGAVSASAPIGFAETVLAAGTTSSMVDETNLVTVNLGDDVFTSCTRDVLLAGGAEYWAYGQPGRWEIGASAQGDSLGSGRYTLSRHLRGLFGTEPFMGSHAAGDTFILLRLAGMLRPSMGVGDIGLLKSYRAVTKGRSFDSAPSLTYTNTGEGLRPLSPINLRRGSLNEITVDRRSRLAMNNMTGTLPVGEAAEAWSWQFYTSGFVTLIGTVLTTTATVTSAQQSAIGVSPTADAFVVVRQISDSVGLGHELQGTAPGAGGRIVTYRDAGAVVMNATGTTVAIPAPAAAVIGDLLIAAVMRRSAVASDPPAGWALVSSTAGATNGSLTQYTHVYTKTAQGSDLGTTTTFSQTSSGLIHGQMIAITGGTGTPLLESQTTAIVDNSASTFTTIPTLTAAGNDRLGVAVGSAIYAQTSPTTQTIGIDSSFTLRSNPTIVDNRLMVATKPMASGATTAATMTIQNPGGTTGGFTKNALIFVAP
jgi:hypothetical protein